MNKLKIIGKNYSLDLGSSIPVIVNVKNIIENTIIVEYINSYPGRIEEFKIKDFEYFAGIKIS